ncbi:MAG: hypothetical protein ABIP63_02065 [Thermoanaerobaculia bacterium]
MTVRRLIVLLLLVLAIPSTTFAADPSLFQDLNWRLIGPFRGGRVLAVSGVPGQPEHFYFGSVNGGVWESQDAGRTWQPIFDGQPIGSIGALAVAPSNPQILYVGTGEADMRSDIAQGDGMYRSADGGRTWAHIGLTDSQQIARILVDPSDPQVVLVAALGHPYGPNAERGVFRSRDGGTTWKKVLGRDDNTGAVDLAWDPADPKTVYAALWQTRRTPWSIYPPSNGPGSGLFKSTDGGETWSEIRGHGFPEKPGRIGLAVAAGKAQRVYAIVDAPEGGMVRSDDGGANWIRTSSDSRIWSRGWYFGGITIEPKDPDVIYSCNVNVYRSADGGKTFVPIKGAPGGDDYHSLWIDPREPQRRILGVDQGAVVSVNGGKTWSSWYNQPTGQFYHVSTDNSFPYRVYGSQQDSGAAGVPSRTGTIDGITLSDFREMTAGGESDNLAPDPNDPEIIYGGRVDRLDLRTRQTRSIDPNLAYPNLDRRTWTLPLVFSPRNPKVLYFANQRLFRTDDGGGHWTVISPDLTREDPGTPATLDAATAALQPRPGGRHGVIYSIAPSRMTDRDLWVGTDDGSIWRTRDEGGHWTNVTPTALTGWSKVGILDASHFDAETAYAAVDRHRIEDVRPYIYRTRDGGKHWDLIVDGIPAGSFVNAVREDPVRKGLLYAGTEKGVYVSFDDGDHWQSLQKNLPVTSVRDLVVHGNDLVIATHGRAFWILDDVTPLRQTAEAAAARGAYLFKPATAVRERPSGFTGTPMPKDEALASNPPYGAVIDYLLPAAIAASGEVTLEILDPTGTLVRRYSSNDKPAAADPAKLTTAPEWFRSHPPLSTASGMHRFVWPIRYSAPASLSGGRPDSDGVWAPPGHYTVALSVAGQRFSQPLVVSADPRLKLPPSAYNEQFALTRSVESARIRIAGALAEAGKLTTSLSERRAKSASASASPIDSLQREINEVTGADPANAQAWWLPPKSTNSLKFIQGALDKLAEAVDDADAAPSADAQASLALLRPQVDDAIRRWLDFRGQRLATVNKQLEAAGEAPIPTP